MNKRSTIEVLLKRAHAIWIAAIINVGLGFFISGYDPVAQTMSEVAREAPAFAFVHRLANVVIGISIGGFGVALHLLSNRKYSFPLFANLLFGTSLASAGIWTLESPLHLLYNLYIIMILVPMACALGCREILNSKIFDNLFLVLIHVVMFWLIDEDFISGEYEGLAQRLWMIPTMGWYGVSSYLLSSTRGVKF